MKVHCIETAPTPFRDRLLIHHYIFHGVCSREGGNPVWDSIPVFLTTSDRTPLDICRTGCWMPDICIPGSNLIVSEEVRSILSEYPPVEFLDVQFQNLIDLPIPNKGGITAIKDVGFRIDPLSRLFLRTRAHHPELRQGLGKRFEVLTARVADVRKQYPGVRRYKLVAGDRRSGTVEIEVALSKQLCNDFPLLVGGAWILRDDVFSRVEKFFDWRFFVRAEIKFGK